MAEYEVRRLVGTIEKLEDRARNLRDPGMFHSPTDAAQSRFIAAELVSMRSQLRELLAD